MKKYVTPVVFLCFFAAIGAMYSSSAFADDPWDVSEDMKATNEEAGSDENGAQEEMNSRASGKVLGVDTLENTLTVLVDGNNRTYFVGPQTEFTLVSSVAELSPGDMVTIDYYTSLGKSLAEMIILEKKGQATEPASDPQLLEVLKD